MNKVNLLKDVRENGTIEGHYTETYYAPCKAIATDDDGYLRIIADDGATDIETRDLFDTLSSDGWASPSEYAALKAELEELRKDRDLLQFCLDNDTFPVKDQSGAYIMSKDNEFFSVTQSPRKSIELAFEYVKLKLTT